MGFIPGKNIFKQKYCSVPFIKMIYLETRMFCQEDNILRELYSNLGFSFHHTNSTIFIPSKEMPPLTQANSRARAEKKRKGPKRIVSIDGLLFCVVEFLASVRGLFVHYHSSRSRDVAVNSFEVCTDVGTNESAEYCASAQ